MKNLKVLLITSLVAFAVICYADGKPKNVKTITKIAIEQVSTVPGLTGAIYSQVNPGFLKVEKHAVYHAVVNLNGRTYYVYGQRQSWLKFFNLMPVQKQSNWWD